MSKRIIAGLLVLVLLFTSVPLGALAVQPGEQSAVSAEDVSIEGTNGFGTLLSQEITESQAETAEEAENFEGGYSVTDLVIEGTAATVTYSSMEEALLVVALYTEDGMQMLTSATATVTDDATEAVVEFTGEMPEYFMASAYLVDTYDLSPLCAAYDTPLYTREMQELLASTVEDYDADRVLILDENDTSNFAVYAASTKIISGSAAGAARSAAVNVVASVDEENGVYVIENADEIVTGLKVGEVFAYPYEENKLLIVKIAAIDVSGTTVTITGDDLQLEEAFEAVKIDAEEDHYDVDPGSADEGISYETSSAQTLQYEPQNWDASLSHVTSSSVKLDIGETDVYGQPVKLEGSLTFGVQTNITFYVTNSYQMIEFKCEFSADLALTLTGKRQNDKGFKLGKIAVYPLPGISIDMTPEFLIRFTGSMTITIAEFKAAIGFYAEHSKDGWDAQKIWETMKPKFELKLEAELFIGFALTPSVKVLEGWLVDAEIEGQLGFIIKGTLTPILLEPDGDSLHNCRDCLDGDVSFSYKVTPSVKLLKSDSLTLEVEWANCEFKFLDFYWSATCSEFGFGTCPQLSYRTTVSVYDADGKPLEDAEVVLSGGQKLKTNSKGTAVEYLQNGSYFATVSFGESTAIRQIVVADKSQKVIIQEGSNAGSHGVLGTVDSESAADITKVTEDTYENRRYVIYDASMTWLEAQAYCESIGGHLVTITSAEEQAFIESMMESGGKKQYWIGMRYYNGAYRWVTDEIATYWNWDPGQPDHSTYGGLAEDYVQIYNVPNPVKSNSQRFGWNDIYVDNCFRNANESGFFNTCYVGLICEFESEEPGYREAFNGHTYQLIDNGMTSWEDAAAYCETLGGHLATITSQEENDFLYQYMQSCGYGSAYWGFTDKNTEGVWEWCTGEAVTYTNWAEGQPDNDGSENFGMFWDGLPGGVWNDGNFSGSYAYFCEWDSASGSALLQNEITLSPNAVYPGDYSTEVTDTYVLKTASFTGLVPNEQYVLLAMNSIEEEDPLAADNLLFIDQGVALEDGTLSFRYVQRETAEISYVVACGASNKDLADAEITFPVMTADGELQVVDPTVVYDGVTLTEGQDYVIVGTVDFTGEGTYTCYIRGIHNYTGLVECVYTVGKSTVTYTSASISLAGDIGVNYYAQLSEDIVADEGAYMQFTVAGQTQTIPVSEAVVGTDGTYRFTCKVAAKQMTDEITGQMYKSTGPVGEAKVYSVKAYCDAAIPVYSQYEAYADLVDLMEAMLNYGGYSQIQFGYNTANLANAGMDIPLPAIAAEDVAAYAHRASGSESGISVASVSLLLESTTTIRFYFNLEDGDSIDGHTFYVDGVETVPVAAENGQYYVDKVDVAAKDLDEMVTVTVGGLTVAYGGLSYVRQITVLYPDYYSEALVNVAKALYAYNQAANAHFA